MTIFYMILAVVLGAILGGGGARVHHRRRHSCYPRRHSEPWFRVTGGWFL